ncbi:cytochrome c6 PetJ [Mastigocoleus sp. MO_188.B34]|uniref:cytochrome c6 PetJ n=1 Tax=Mastigocoleus sp. MO_188.B34 TaxID=3036635 RepID=UPI0034571560
MYSLKELWKSIRPLKLLYISFFLLLLSNTVFLHNASAMNIPADINHGEKIFKANCAGCHINGGNIIRRGKNLKLRALKRYKMDSVEAISAIVANGKNNMSAYKDRLSVTEIRDVAAYVLGKAETGWK